MNKKFFPFLLSFAASMMFPAASILNYTFQNAAWLNRCAIGTVIGILILITSAVWLLNVLLAKKVFVAFLATLLFNILIQFFGSIEDKTSTFFAILICVVIFILLNFLIAWLLKKIKNQNKTILLLMVTFPSVFFLLNIVPWIRYYTGSNDLTYTYSEDYYKTKFTVSCLEKQSPNIYWIHCDGMIGINYAEKLFDLNLNNYKRAFEDRGFFINENATLKSEHSTRIGISMLCSPYFYDSFYKNVLENVNYLSVSKYYFCSDLGKMIDFSRYRNELLRAFYCSGYQTNFMPYSRDVYYYVMPFSERVYTFADDFVLEMKLDPEKVFSFDDEIELFFNLMPSAYGPNMSSLLYERFRPMYYIMHYLKKFTDYKDISFDGHSLLNALRLEENIAERLPKTELRSLLVTEGMDTNNPENIPYNSSVAIAFSETIKTSETPLFTFIANYINHVPFVYNEDGSFVSSSTGYRLEAVEGNYIFSLKVLLSWVDQILENDKDAVIVLQADHGFQESKNALANFFGYYEQEMYDSTMSAVRVPEKYKNGEEQYAYENPLNISRYLVNSFVGRNYEYIN